ncbi:hypothetical protein CPBF424_39110 [Xanthomonas euroxanthea]|uniref:Uncharacterized protein n=1 Tax=Xanthomonas euroxanthea TaxID=2259622 RepID=A0AA46HCC5_9XANT|nr:hypothetical protein CPBF424_39110 [Xanthomonas euroxanthea]
MALQSLVPVTAPCGVAAANWCAGSVRVRPGAGAAGGQICKPHAVAGRALPADGNGGGRHGEPEALAGSSRPAAALVALMEAGGVPAAVTVRMPADAMGTPATLPDGGRGTSPGRRCASRAGRRSAWSVPWPLGVGPQARPPTRRQTVPRRRSSGTRPGLSGARHAGPRSNFCSGSHARPVAPGQPGTGSQRCATVAVFGALAVAGGALAGVTCAKVRRAARNGSSASP